MDIHQRGVIIWDWNGTLLDDVDICIASMNGLLKKRNLPILTNKIYKQVFTFPVKDYYREVGFDFSQESFDDIAVEFIDAYRIKVKKATTFERVDGILSAFKNAGFKQFLISAMEHEFLEETLIANNVLQNLEAFSGINDHHANGKLEMAKRFFEKQKIKASEVTFVGDTIHDFEVAEGLGVKSVLIASGHQSFERLSETGTTVVKEITDLITYFQLDMDNHTIINTASNTKN